MLQGPLGQRVHVLARNMHCFYHEYGLTKPDDLFLSVLQLKNYRLLDPHAQAGEMNVAMKAST